jgi:hypothetical protein
MINVDAQSLQEPSGDPRDWYYGNKAGGESAQILHYSKPTLCIKVGSSEWSQVNISFFLYPSQPFRIVLCIIYSLSISYLNFHTF